MGYRAILCISDTQFPFHHIDTFVFLKAVAKKYKVGPKHKDSLVIHQGDEIDMHALGRWAVNPDGYSAGQELELALEGMHELYKMFPSARVCTSNHTVRPLKKAFDSGIPRAFMRDYSEFLQAPKDWKWADRWVFNNVCFEHGENVSGPNAALNAAKQNMMSTSIGHQHSYGGVKYYATHDKTIFGMNTGCLINLKAYAFAYGNKMRVKPTLGCGIINNGAAVFVPMLLDKHRRWTGVLP
jgi:hypothetical protein